jgi:hypothetical protein
VIFSSLTVALWLADPWHDALALIAAAVLYRPAADLIRLVAATRAARRHYLGMIRARHGCTGCAGAPASASPSSR